MQGALWIKVRILLLAQALLCAFHCVILFFKLFSYAFVNKWERDLLTNKTDGGKSCSAADSDTLQG